MEEKLLKEEEGKISVKKGAKMWNMCLKAREKVCNQAENGKQEDNRGCKFCIV